MRDAKVISMKQLFQCAGLGLLLSASGCRLVELITLPLALAIHAADNAEQESQIRMRTVLHEAEKSASRDSACSVYMRRGSHRAGFAEEFGPSGMCWENGPELRRRCLAICVDLDAKRSGSGEPPAEEIYSTQIVRAAVAQLNQQEKAVAGIAMSRLGNPALAEVAVERPPARPMSEKCWMYLSSAESHVPAFKSVFGPQSPCWSGDLGTARECNNLCENMSLTGQTIVATVSYPDWN